MKKIFRKNFLVIILFFSLTLLYLFPLTQGLILLPLDLLISKYNPWYAPGTILLKNSYMQDSIIQLYPWRHLVYESLKDGIIPFWNPYQFAGQPFMANMKSMVFYPFNLLFLMGEVWSWNLLLFGQVFLAMFFAYLFARELRLTLLTSFLVGLSFSLNSLMIGVLEFGSEGHVLMWAPLLFYSVKKLLDQPRAKFLLLTAFGLTFSVLAGQLQYLAYIFLSLLGFAIVYGRFLNVRTYTYVVLFLALTLGIGMSALQLIPSLELFFCSKRGIDNSYEIFTSGLMTFDKTLRFFSPDIFGHPTLDNLKIGYIEESGYFGLIPLFFCLYAIFFVRRNLFVRYFAGVFTLSLLLSFKQIGLLLYFLRVPIITSGSGGRVVLLTFLSGAVLAGFGLKSFLRDQKRFRTIIFGLIFGLIVALIRPHFFFPLAILGLLMFSLVFYTLFFKKEIASLVFTLVVLVLTFVDLFRFGYRFLTFSNLKFLYPETEVVQYLKKGSKDNLTRNFGLVDPELATSLGLYTLETYNPLYLARNAYLFQALQGKLPSEPLPVNKYFFDVKKGRTKAVLDWLGVGYVVTGRDTNPASEYFTDEAEKELKLVFRDDKYAVYQNKTVLPRFGLYYKYQTVTDDQEILELLSSNLSDFKDKLILEESLPIELKIGQGEARLIYADVNSLKFMVNTNQPALFYLSDAFFPGWQVEVNQKLLPVHRANYNFRAVLVPVGESVVEFFYRPRYFFFSLMISLFSIISLWILSIKLRK